MTRRSLLAALAAVPFLRRWAKTAPAWVSGMDPGGDDRTIVTMPGGARFTGERLPDGWIRMRDPWSPTGYVDMRQVGSGADVRVGSREYGTFDQAKIVLT